LVDKQNVEVEADILFYKLFKVWHMIDRADRWHAAMEIQTKEATELQQAIDKTWLRHFGPFKVLVIDGEKGIDSIATKEWLQRHGIELRIRAKGQHARMIERRGAILRHCMHTTEEQLEKEGITVTFDELLSTAVLSGNALTNVGGGTPYQARLGSTPAILPDMMIPQERGTTIGGLERMRTIALEKIVAATAIARINRASGSMTTASGEAHAYEPGELIDFHTPASQADVSNWQGPATVIENKPSEGLVKFKWKAQNMSRRYAEVRRFMDFTAVVFGYLATPSTSAGGAAKCLLTTLSHMRENSIVTVGFVKQSDTWIPTQLHSTHKHVAYAVEFLVKNVFHATGVVAAKLGKSVSTFKSFKGAIASKLLWWNSKVGFDNMQSADMFDTSGYHTKNIVGDDWQKQNYLQLLLAPNAGIDLSALLDPEIGNIDHSTSGKSNDANASGRTSAVDPDQLSRIDEGDEGDDAPEWFANDVWLTCTPEQKAIIKDIEAEANDPEIAVDMEEDYINQAKEVFSDSRNLEAEVFSSGTVAASVTDSPEPPGNTTVVAITWPDQDEHGNMYVSIPFLGDAAKLITMEPVPEKHQAEIRAYLKTNASQVFIEVEDEPVIDGGKSYDDLTSADYKQHSDKVNEAVYAELKTWIEHDCFEMIPRMGARNILDLRWVGKWKKLKTPQILASSSGGSACE